MSRQSRQPKPPQPGPRRTDPAADAAAVGCSAESVEALRKGMAAIGDAIRGFHPVTARAIGANLGRSLVASLGITRSRRATRDEALTPPSDPAEAFAVAIAANLLGVRACDGCGCTDDAACEGGCTWVGPYACSRCASPLTNLQ